MTKTLCALIAAATALLAAAPASAEVTIEGSGEPLYTKSTQNTQWFHYSQPSGTDEYRLRLMYYRDNALVHDERVTVSGTGTIWADWAGVATLQEGSVYGICAQGEYSFENDSLFFPDGPNSCALGTMQGKRSATTIDRTKPTISLTAAGGAEHTKSASIPVSIGFQDATAGPFPANFLCVQAGTGPCDGVYGYSAQCSQPGSGAKNTSFACAIDASALPDGPVTVCAKAADASVPDNASSADQAGQAGQANISDAQCDTVVLDRQGPALAVSASKSVALVGEAVAFSSQATDAGSGIDPATARYEWSDGAPATEGTSATRTFTAPGTYTVTFRARDMAGNESTAHKTVTVQAPASTGGPAKSPVVGAPPTPPAPGNAFPGIRIGDVTVQVPKRVRIGKARKLVIATRADAPGVLVVRLVRGKRTFSKISKGVAPGDSKHRLRLPKTVKPGTYAVKISFKAAGATWAATGTAKVALRR